MLGREVWAGGVGVGAVLKPTKDGAELVRRVTTRHILGMSLKIVPEKAPLPRRKIRRVYTQIPIGPVRAW